MNYAQALKFEFCQHRVFKPILSFSWVTFHRCVGNCSPQRLYRKDRHPSAYFCYLQLAKFGIVQGICLYTTWTSLLQAN